MKDKIENGALALLACCALVITALVVRREFIAPPLEARPVPGARTQRTSAVEHPDWMQFAVRGQRIGKADAPVVILAFSDFQCPYCGDFAKSLRAVRTKYGDRVAVVFRHFPLESIHPYARDAAVAAECAGAEGQFAAYHDALFDAQQMIGIQTWTTFATEAGVRDTARFSRCMETNAPQERVDEDLAAGRQFGVSGTPTVVVGGTVVTGAPSQSALDSLVNLALARAGSRR